MTPPVPSYAPTAIVAGDTVKFTTSLSDYPVAAGWTLKAALRGERAINATVTVSGEERTVTFPAADTATLTPGRYLLALWVEGAGASAGEQYTVRTSAVQVSANVEQAQAGQLQSYNEKLVAAGEARLYGRLTDEQVIESYGIAGRTVTKVEIAELDKMLRRWRWDVWKERHPGKLGPAVRGRFVA